MTETVSSDPILSLARPEILADPYPTYARFRREQPAFFYEPLGSWMFSRYDDCVAVLRDSAGFAADWRRVGEKMPPRAVNMLTLDPPEHTAVRRPFMEALRQQDSTALEAVVAAHTDELLARLARRPSFDFLTELAEPLALSTTAAYLGVAAPDTDWMSRIGRAVGAGMDAGLWPERGKAVMEAQEELAVLVDGWLADAPGTGVLGAVVSRSATGDIDPAILANTVRGLLFSGYSSGSKLLALLAVAVLHQEAAALPDLVAGDSARTVDELVRYCSPIHAVARACVDDTRIGDTPVRAGQAVTLLLGAANRDPDRFRDPETIDPGRHPNPHLGFGRGPKACLGSPFSAVLLRVVLRRLAETYPSARAMSTPTYQQNLTLRSLDRFEVALR